MSLSRLRNTRLTRGRVAVMGLVAALAAALAIPSAQAAPTTQAAPAGWQAAHVDALARDLGVSKQETIRQLNVQSQLSAVADTLGGSLGSRMKSSRIDWASGKLVVDVLDAAAAAQVSAAGAQPRLLDATLVRKLDSAKASLDAAGTDAAGFGWAVDADTLVVSVPAGASSATSAKFLAKARALGVPLRVETIAGAIGTQVFRGGEAILATTGGRCSSGFIASGGGNQFVITAGHCTEIAANWRASGNRTLGVRQVISFPGNDYGSIRITNTGIGAVGEILNGGGIINITGFSRVPVGSRVCKTGSTTGTTCGVVQQYNMTVNYGGGDIVGGLTRTNVCTQPGDSGGGLFASNLAQGITSGGTVGGCSTPGFLSIFQPVDEAVRNMGLTLL